MNPLWTIKHGAGTTYPNTTLENVQAVNISWGRTVITDPLSSGRYIIHGRRPDLLPTITLGDRIEMQAWQGSSGASFYINCRVADFVIHYGIIASMDTWEIVCEDAHAVLGRAQITTTWAAGYIEQAIKTVCTAAGTTFSTTALALNTCSVNGGSTTDGRALDIVQQFFNSYVPVKWIPQDTTILGTYSGGANTFYATDNTTVPANYLIYNDIEFSGIAENYAPYVITTSPSVGTVTAGSGTRSYQMSTYNSVPAEQSTSAQRMSALLSSAINVPVKIGYTASQQASATRPLPWTPDWTFGSNVLVLTFRGNTYNTIVIGGTISVTPDDTRVALNIVPSSWLSAFTLDSSTLGVLGTNRLA